MRKKSKYWSTSDGQEFFHDHHARAHARTLEDKTVHPPSTDNDFDVVGAETVGKAAEGDLAGALRNFDPKAPDAYAEGQELLKALGINTPNKKKATVLAAIAEAQAKLPVETSAADAQSTEAPATEGSSTEAPATEAPATTTEAPAGDTGTGAASAEQNQE